jgi:hypothetical protein
LTPLARLAGYLRPGDYVILALSLAALAALWGRQGGAGDGVVIRAGGAIFLATDLRLDRTVTVPGPLGDTRVEIRAGQVRVAADPSPRQLCVRQGWLAPGSSAVCLPNRVSVERGHSGYDSINY